MNEYLDLEDTPIEGRKNSTFGVILYSAIIFAILGVVVLSLGGCYTIKKANKQFSHAVNSYPAIGEKFCARTFPPIETTKENIVYREGEVKVLPGETIYVNCDSAIKKSVKYVVAQCPPSYKTVDSIFITKTVTVVNHAAVDSANRYAHAQYDKLIKSDTSLKTWKKTAWIAIGISALLIIGIVINIYLKFRSVKSLY